MSKIAFYFENLKKKQRKAFIVYLTVGYPDLATTEEMILRLSAGGVDLIELGVPFSDPLADGPIIQYSSYYALKNKVTLRKVFTLVDKVRKNIKTPLVIMSYYNPLYQFGLKKFLSQTVEKGIDGVIIPDLPVDEKAELKAIYSKKKLDFIFLLAPTSPEERITQVVKYSSGFIYYVSVVGITGPRERLNKEIEFSVKKIKQKTNLPICVGFGISTPQQVKKVISYADGFIIGSALIKIMEEEKNKEKMFKKVENFVKEIQAVQPEI
jgi:tryptophan synthase alpha chain